MGSYIPNSALEQEKMLAFLGLQSLDALYDELPANVLLKKELNIPSGKSELEVRRQMQAMADRNRVFRTVFRGAGAYRHYIPSIVKAVASKEKFITAYTPYQPEISQGVLQSIFEFQTMICELTGMDGANASVYDGASACAESIAMCVDADDEREIAYVSATINPDYLRTVKTYCYAANRQLVVIPEKNGVTDLDFLKNNMGENAACVLIQQPNYYGIIEDAAACADIAHDVDARFIMCINPFFAAIGKTPGECDADIAVGEGQPLGLSLGFGGPYLGFMAATRGMMRKLPGRIVGQTKDVDGKRAFVLTMQAREQHIRRELASSNICSNQALCALTASCFLSAMGPGGVREAANQCLSKAHYAASQIGTIPGYERMYDGAFFHEFVTKCPVNTDALMEKLEAHDILGGYPVNSGILWCFTEMNTKAEIDELVSILKEGV